VRCLPHTDLHRRALGAELQAFERTGAEAQIAGSDRQHEGSPTDARALAALTWDEIGEAWPNARSPQPELSANQSKLADAFGRRFMWLSPRELHPHPSVERYGIATTTAEHNRIAQQDDAAFQEAVEITRTGTILDGYAQWKAALDAHCSQISVLSIR
jgi:hypothetical protein